MRKITERDRDEARRHLDLLPMNVENLISAWEAPDPNLIDRGGVAGWARDMANRVDEIRDAMDIVEAVVMHDLWVGVTSKKSAG